MCNFKYRLQKALCNLKTGYNLEVYHIMECLRPWPHLCAQTSRGKKTSGGITEGKTPPKNKFHMCNFICPLQKALSALATGHNFEAYHIMELLRSEPHLCAQTSRENPLRGGVTEGKTPKNETAIIQGRRAWGSLSTIGTIGIDMLAEGIAVTCGPGTRQCSYSQFGHMRQTQDGVWGHQKVLLQGAVRGVVARLVHLGISLIWVLALRVCTGEFHPRRWRERGKIRHHPALERDRTKTTRLKISLGIQLHLQHRHVLVGGIRPIKIRQALLIAQASGQPPPNSFRTRPGSRALGGTGAPPASRSHADSSYDTKKTSARPHACTTRRSSDKHLGEWNESRSADTEITDRAVHPAGTRAHDYVRDDTPRPCRSRPHADTSPVTQLRTDPPLIRSSMDRSVRGVMVKDRILPVHKKTVPSPDRKHKTCACYAEQSPNSSNGAAHDTTLSLLARRDQCCGARRSSTRPPGSRPTRSPLAGCSPRAALHRQELRGAGTFARSAARADWVGVWVGSDDRCVCEVLHLNWPASRCCHTWTHATAQGHRGRSCSQR